MSLPKAFYIIILIFTWVFILPACVSKKITVPIPPPLSHDVDGDGVKDEDDRCPDVAGLTSLKGCPDRDADGIADIDDKCPDVSGVARYNGCPIPDSDKDGVNDEEDKCPTVSGLARYNGCPIPDTDGDGVNDEEDKCINEKGSKSNFGCPEIEENIKSDTDNDGIPDDIDKCPTISAPHTKDGCPDVKIKNQHATVTVNDTLTVSEDKFLAIKDNLGILTFYCPPKMREGESELVTASIGSILKGPEMMKNILDAVNETRHQRNEKPITESDITEKNIEISKYINIELRDPADRFILKPILNQINWRTFNPNKEEEWSWSITPKLGEGGKSKASLILVVLGKNEKGDSAIIKTKAYVLEIALPLTLWQSFLKEARDIKWLFGIVGSVAAFFLGIWKGRKKKEENNEKKRPDNDIMASAI